MNRLFHIFLFALYPSLFLYTKNMAIVDSLDFALAAAVSLVLAGTVYFFLQFVMRERPKQAFLTSATLLLFFSFGQGMTVLSQVHIKTGLFFIGPGKTLLFLTSLIWLLLFFILKRKGLPQPITFFLNITSLLLVSFTLFPVLTHSFSTTYKKNVINPISGNDTTGRRQPDIYFILMDGRARSDVLRNRFQYNDSLFCRSLTSKGFFIAESSFANYNKTITVLTSILNMDYVPCLAEKSNNSILDLRFFLESIRHNTLFYLLRDRGYRITAFDGDGLALFHPEDVDSLVATPEWDLTPYLNQFINLSPLPVLIGAFKGNETRRYDHHRNKILHALESLKTIPGSAYGPHFVFAHLLLPHEPFIFSRTGKSRYPSYPFSIWHSVQENNWIPADYDSAYAEQVKYGDKRILGVIDTLLRYSPHPPIIVLQSDHGPSGRLDLGSVEKSDVHERMAILNALYLPGIAADWQHKDMTPVNTFRIILNHYFGDSLPLFPNRNYFDTWDKPYRFTDITERLKRPMQSEVRP